MEEVKTIKVLIKEPDKAPYVAEIENDYKIFQKYVDGTIDVISLPTMENVDVIVNDEFLNLKMKGNFFIPHYEQCVAGTCIIAGFNPEDGDNISLTDKQIRQAKNYIKAFEIPIGLDLYQDFAILDEFMKHQMKSFDRKQEEM